MARPQKQLIKAATVMAYYSDPKRGRRNEMAKVQMADYFRRCMDTGPNWGGINAEDLVDTLAEALVVVGMEQKLGTAMLEAFAQQINERVRALSTTQE